MGPPGRPKESRAGTLPSPAVAGLDGRPATLTVQLHQPCLVKHMHHAAQTRHLGFLPASFNRAL